jgi:sec-independent protein translocase protein TatC
MSGGGPSRTMTFWQHLAELRVRLVIALAAMALCGCAAYYWREWLYALLLYPLEAAKPGIKLHYFSPTEPFFVYLRIAAFAGVAAGSPVALYQLWAFIAPGLTPRERRIAAPILPVVLLLFAAGVLFVWFGLLPVTLKFLIGLAPEQLAPTLSQERYFGFVTALCLAGGVLFELPAALGLLGFLGLVDARWLWRYTPHATVALLFLAAVITPTGDAFTMLALSAPMLLLYFLSIAVVWAVRRVRRPE